MSDPIPLVLCGKSATMAESFSNALNSDEYKGVILSLSLSLIFALNPALLPLPPLPLLREHTH